VEFERGVAGLGSYRDGATVLGDDGVDEGESEACSSGCAGPRGVATAEALEDLVDERNWDSGPVVVHGDSHVVFSGLHADPDRSAGRGMSAGVVEQVGEHLVEALLVADDLDWSVWEGEGPAMVGIEHAGVRDSFDDESCQFYLCAFQRTSSVQPCKEEQVFHQRGHPRRLRFDLGHGVGELLRVGRCDPAGQFGVAVDCG